MWRVVCVGLCVLLYCGLLCVASIWLCIASCVLCVVWCILCVVLMCVACYDVCDVF